MLETVYFQLFIMVENRVWYFGLSQEYYLLFSAQGQFLTILQIHATFLGVTIIQYLQEAQD